MTIIPQMIKQFFIFFPNLGKENKLVNFFIFFSNLKTSLAHFLKL